MNTHGIKCTFGRHSGELYTRIPVSYLKWMVNSRHQDAEIAQAELDRRGTVTPDIEISGHAIDRISQNGLHFWEVYRDDGEGLHAWMARAAIEALDKGEFLPSGKIRYAGLKWVIESDGVWPVVKTVMPA